MADDRPSLPTPVTREDQLLTDIASSLRTLVDHIQQPDDEPEDGRVPLREPALSSRHTGGGWYEIVDPEGVVVDKVRGREAAEEATS